MATTFTNQATLSMGGAQTLSNIAVGVMDSALSISKAAVQAEYSVGDTITYVVSIVNNTTTEMTGLTVIDDLGTYPFGAGTVQPLTYVDGSIQYYLDGVQQAAPSVSAADGLSVAGITIPAQGNTTLIYSAQINSYAPLQTGSTINNTVSINDTGKVSVIAQESVAVNEDPQLELVKSVSPIPVSENGRLTYTIQLLNSGNTAVLADDGAVITDTFDPILSDIAVTLDGTALAPTTNYTYNALTGEFSTVAGTITVPAATYAQDPATGEWTVTPGSATLVVTGTV